jgi:hypothetical protein
MHEIEYKTTKAIFSVDPNQQVAEINPSSRIEFDENEAEELLKNLSETLNKQKETPKINPLFNV